MSDNLINRTEGYGLLGDYARRFDGTYADVDAATQSGLCLCALREDLDLATLEEILERIAAAMPALKRIFSTPIIRLRDSGEVLPVEAVRVVNSKTLAHISVHSELWSNIKDDKLIPRKLMSIRQDDDYAIYENIVFARTVDLILGFTARNLRILRDMLYANRELSFNLLERENHPSYFLALGKLHTGYLRDYDKYLLPIERCYRLLSSIERSLGSRLGAPVYRKCRSKKHNLGLKKTNIFRSHKDYRKLYSLSKYFSEIGLNSASVDTELAESGDYLAFCSMLSVFAAGHFNFKFDRKQKIDFVNINTDAAFESWRLNIRAEDGGIALTLAKDREYKILLSPSGEACSAADEVVRISESGEDSVRLSVYDVDSFRRVQGMLLRGMIYADLEKTTCPFCGKELTKTDDAHECGACRTIIRENICPETGERYFSTGIKHFVLPKSAKQYAVPESAMFYRNITRLGSDCRSVCPRCGKEH